MSTNFSAGPWDWWHRQPEAKIHQEVGRVVISVPATGRLQGIIAAAPELMRLLDRYVDGAEIMSDAIALLARIEPTVKGGGTPG